MLKDSNIDKESFKIGLLIVVLLMLLVNNFFNAKDADKIDYIKKEIKEVKSEINLVYKENKRLQSKLDDFKTEIKQIDRGININNKKIQNLKTYEKEQISSFATYGNSEWEKYFADRYKK
jgi:septal ring factor EnvC (AmiA/AmiB activator)